MAMEFDRGWDFDHGNTPITLNKIKQDDETIAAITALVDAMPGGGPSGGDLGDLTDDTVDTDSEFRLILFSNGNVRAIPVGVVDPVAPTGLIATPTVATVKLQWTAAVPTPSSYAIFRDGVQVGTAGYPAVTFTDRAVVSGNTYEYQLKSVDPYGQRSDLSEPPVEAYVDPLLNEDPLCTVTSWPAVAPTDGKTILRVCGSDIDGQVLAFALECASGVLEPTDDPTVWYYTPGA